ncbi:MAG: protease inhibitor I42 family protein [Candidatus Omnitrophota bacterium]
MKQLFLILGFIFCLTLGGNCEKANGIQNSETQIWLTPYFVNLLKIDGKLCWYIEDYNPSTGYHWEVKNDGSKVCKLVNTVILLPWVHAVGVPGKIVWQFKAVKLGKGVITFQLFPPGRVRPEKEVKINVSVGR